MPAGHAAAAGALDGEASAARVRSGQWKALWLSATVMAAVSASLIDAVLLQRKRTYFTGGFLSVDHITTPAQALGFVASSLALDVAVAGVLVALVLWAAGRTGASRRAAWIVAVLAALAPVIVADVVTYQLLTYLGDAFDFGLMFDLAGNSVSEIFAVSSEHLGGLGMAAALVVVAMGATVWLLVRRATSSPAPQVRFRTALAVPLALFVAVGVTTTFVRTASDVLDDGLKRKPAGRLLGTLADALSDVDFDGFGILGRVRDPNPFDAGINPYALDVPGNGIDEDGLAGDLPATTAPYREPVPDTHVWSSRRDVVLVVLESFRADAAGARVGGMPVTPVLDSLAARGIRVNYAFSHNGYTVQSRRHIFTGSVADIRGATLVDDFKANGYETGYFSGQDDSFGGAGASVGLERADARFDARAASGERYTTFTTPGSLAVPSDVVNDRVAAFLHRRAKDKPLFLYVNFHDTHFPYHHAGIRPLVGQSVLDQFEIGPARADVLRSMYLNTAANVDRAVGELLRSVHAALGREPAVIVLSDHGESLYDAGFLGHGYALDDAQTRIPFIAANLPLAIVEPFGQADLREALQVALNAADQSAPPTMTTDASRAVFQYLGTIDAPAQIAFTRIGGQFLYDFRSGLVQIDRGTWRDPADLPPDATAMFRELVQTWERMRLARSGRVAAG